MLSQLIQSHLKHDPDLKRQLLPLVGKIIRLELHEFGWSGDFTVDKNTVHFARTPIKASSPDALLQGTLHAFITSFLAKGDTQTNFEQQLRVSGDMRTLNHLQAVLKTVDIDWEEYLSHYLGDQVAYRVGQGVRQVGKRLDRVRENFPTHLKEYLQEEIKLLPTRSEANRFYEEVRRLRDCVERLEQEV